ncbi:hypothetical protein AB0B18_24270 [Micromonospora chalcea]
MTEDPGRAVTVTARRQQGWTPWFGDMASFERLCRLCGKVFESRQTLYSDALELTDGGSHAPGASSVGDALHATAVRMSFDDETRTYSGTVSSILPLIDFPHFKRIELLAEVPRYPDVGIHAKLHLVCAPGLGMRLEVAANDEAWVAQAFAQISEEAKRRRPIWASMSSALLKTYMMALAGVLFWALTLVTIAALDTRFNTWKWWLIVAAGNAAVGISYHVLRRTPTFELHAEGARPRRQAYLVWLLYTIPTTLFFGIIINLLTG